MKLIVLSELILRDGYLFHVEFSFFGIPGAATLVFLDLGGVEFLALLLFPMRWWDGLIGGLARGGVVVVFPRAESGFVERERFISSEQFGEGGFQQ